MDARRRAFAVAGRSGRWGGVNTGGCARTPRPGAQRRLTERYCRNFFSLHRQNRETGRALATLRISCVFLNPPPRDPLASFFSPALLWLAPAFTMLVAAFLAGAAE